MRTKTTVSAYFSPFPTVIESLPVESVLCMSCGKYLPAPKGTTQAEMYLDGVKVVEHLLPGYRHVKRVCPGSGQVVRDTSKIN